MLLINRKIKLFSLVFLALACFCFLAYSNTLNNPFIWDDEALVVRNTLLRQPQLWYKAFTNDLYFGVSEGTNFYRPVQALSNMFDYAFWQLNPFGFHLTNIFLQVIAAFLFFCFARVFFKNNLLSFSAALLFALCPIATEAVSYVSGRADLLAAIFLLSAFLLFKNNKIFLSLFFFALGLLSKELVLVFPFVVLAYGYYFFGGKLINAAKRAMPFFAISAVYLILRLTLLKFIVSRPPALVKFPLLIRLSVIPKVIFTYFKLLVFPFDLHMSYELTRPTSFFGIFLAYFCLGSLVVICAYLLKYNKSHKVSAFLLFWALAFFLPQSGVFPINAFVAEHFIYLPSLSFFMLVIFLLHKYLKKELFAGCVFCLALYYGVLTYARNYDWQNPLVFYKKIIAYSPASFQGHNNLGLQYEARGKLDLAEAEYKKALLIMPDLLEARSNLASLYYKVGRLSEAKKEYAVLEKAYSGSKAGEIQNNIGALYETAGDLDEAARRYKLALKLDPSLNSTRFNLTKVYLAKGEIDSAIAELLNSLPEIKINKEASARAIQGYLKSTKVIKPAALFYNDLGISLARDSLPEAAICAFQRAVELNPRYADAHFNLGLLYYNLGLKPKAALELRTALKFNPKHYRAAALAAQLQRK
ncbi:MAG: tetratricopeptide repeat protein [Candidatus Omnitrophota bacterium]